MLQNKNRVYTLFVAGDWVRSNFSLLAWWHALMSSLSAAYRCSAHWHKPSECLRPWCWGETAEVSPLLSITVAYGNSKRQQGKACDHPEEWRRQDGQLTTQWHLHLKPDRQAGEDWCSAAETLLVVFVLVSALLFRICVHFCLFASSITLKYTVPLLHFNGSKL